MIYQILIRLLSPLIVILLALDAYKRNGGWQFIKQRCGFAYHSKQRQYQYWIHCASVGEVNAALPILKQLPISKVLVTTNTPTGKQFLLKHLPEVSHLYCPFDWPYAIKRFLNRVQPEKLWILETEIWPNMYELTYSRKISIKIINGRLSNKTLLAPKWLRREYKNALKLVDAVLAKSKRDKQRFVKLGMSAEKIVALGNIKFAQVNHIEQHARLIEEDYVLLASSHKDEELNIAHQWHDIKTQQHRKETLVVAPRHPKRCAGLQIKLQKQGYQVQRYSQLDSNQAFDILLIDELGLLSPLYEHATAVIIGGSFIERGGQNLLEACAYGKAVLTGPDMSNFAEETELFKQANGIIQCLDYQDLNKQLSLLLSDAEARYQLEKNALNCSQKQQQIFEKYLRRLNLK